MIVSLRGTLLEKEPTRVVLEAAGVGYEVLIPISTYERLPRVGNEATLKTVHIIREDDEILFGFATDPEREMFRKLTSVSGVGPKIAAAILSGATVGELSLAISGGNAKRLSSIKGVGKKTAEKICVELKDKVNALEALAANSASAGSQAAAYLHDAILALGALGFNEETASKMVADVVARDPSVKDTETVIRRALSGGQK